MVRMYSKNIATMYRVSYLDMPSMVIGWFACPCRLLNKSHLAHQGLALKSRRVDLILAWRTAVESSCCPFAFLHKGLSPSSTLKGAVVFKTSAQGPRVLLTS